jgi:NAD(P)-dependent dehydrogenase (short-subunit alcohol dehydrogenase family)
VEEPGAKATATEIEKGGGHALPVHLDVTEGASCRAGVAAAAERFGGLDILMYGAADSDKTATVLEITVYFASTALAWRSSGRSVSGRSQSATSLA